MAIEVGKNENPRKGKRKMKLKEILRSIFFPRNLTCSVCGRESFSGDTICDGCKSILPYNDSAICDHCGRQTVYPTEYCDFCKGKQSYLELCRSAFVYEEPIGQVVRRLKYNGEKYLAEELAEHLKKCFLKDMRYADGIVYVPTSQKRIKERGYNQSFLLAKELAKKIEVPLLEGVIVKTRETKSQVGLTEKQRKENLQGSFKVTDKSAVEGKRILVVDDVLTTGTTVETMARVLSKAGASQIIALTVASVCFKKVQNKDEIESKEPLASQNLNEM